MLALPCRLTLAVHPSHILVVGKDDPVSSLILDTGPGNTILLWHVRLHVFIGATGWGKLSPWVMYPLFIVDGEQGSAGVNIQQSKVKWRLKQLEEHVWGLLCMEIMLTSGYVCIICTGSPERRTQDSAVWARHPTAAFLQLHGERLHTSIIKNNNIKMDLQCTKIKTLVSVSDVLASRIICMMAFMFFGSMCVRWPQYLACLKTSRSQTDKLSFDVGLQEDSTGKRKALQLFSFILVVFILYFHSFPPSLWLVSLNHSAFPLFPFFNRSLYFICSWLNFTTFPFSISINIPSEALYCRQTMCPTVISYFYWAPHLLFYCGILIHEPHSFSLASINIVFHKTNMSDWVSLLHF